MDKMLIIKLLKLGGGEPDYVMLFFILLYIFKNALVFKALYNLE